MKIKTIEIENFRSLQKVKIEGPLDDLWTFVGQNNAGKSAVFAAIRAFYGDYKIILDDFNRLESSAKQIEITIEYILENEEEVKNLPVYYLLPGDRLKVKKIFTKEDLKGSGRGFEFKDGKEMERDEEFFGAKNVQVGKLGDVIFIPAVKDLSDELKNNNYALFRKLISRVISEALTELPSYIKLKKDTETFVSDVKSPVKRSPDGEIKSVSEIQEELDGYLESWKIKTEIKIDPPSPEEIIIGGSDLKFINKLNNSEENPLNMGSGAQRSIVNSLLMLWAKIENQKPKKDKKLFHSDLSILLYEEPESLLHYDQEKKLLKNLELISKSPSSQVFICTHSPNLISTKVNAIRTISRFVNEKGYTDVYRASEVYVGELEKQKANFDFTLWLNSDRNTLFFVDRIVLVEGSADKVFLNYIIDNADIEENLYVIDCGWKGNMPLFINLAEIFGIPHLVMFDEDGNKITTSVSHKDLNEKIIQSKNKFTLETLSFPETLEEFVGFDTAGTHDKPRLILNQLRDGKLKKEHEEIFVNFLKK